MVSSRIRTALALTLALLALFPVEVLARGSGRSSAYSAHSSASGRSHRSALSSTRSSIKCESCPRDIRGKIKHSPKAVSEYKRTNPISPACHQCEVDHIVPLSTGGQDEPSNMQWLPKAQRQDKTRRDLRP
jgi:hypothetical protein